MPLDVREVWSSDTLWSRWIVSRESEVRQDMPASCKVARSPFLAHPQASGNGEMETPQYEPMLSVRQMAASEYDTAGTPS